MEAIIFIGLQGAGKSTFYREYFLDSHIRINLDMLKTRHRETIIFQACLVAKQPFVVDNTNPTVEDRKRYIEPAKHHKFNLIGYYFQSNLADCQIRNQKREAKKRVPLVGLKATAKKLILPTKQEGFDQLFYVEIDKNYSFKIQLLISKNRDE